MCTQIEAAVQATHVLAKSIWSSIDSAFGSKIHMSLI